MIQRILNSSKTENTKSQQCHTETKDNDADYYYTLEAGEQLNRSTCLRVCEALFLKDISDLAKSSNNTNAMDERSKDTAVETASTMITIDAEQREKLLNAAKFLYEKLRPEHDTSNSEPIYVEIRSVPVSMYANALRHYYVRVENVFEVHPGVRHRLALATWHNITVSENDVHERSLELCGNCCDDFLAYAWQRSEKFNILWNNCDQTLNNCQQSFVISFMLINTLWFTVYQDLLGFVCLCTFSMLLILLLRHQNLYGSMDRNCGRVYVCPHRKHGGSRE